MIGHCATSVQRLSSAKAVQTRPRSAQTLNTKNLVARRASRNMQQQKRTVVMSAEVVENDQGEKVQKGSPLVMPEGGRNQTNSVLAVILGGGAGTRLYPLTKNRAKPAVPIGGAYRLIDVPMSNCINSGLSKIYILTQFNSTSLNRHLAKTYNFGAGGVRFGGEGFVEVLAATQTPTDKEWFQGTADAVRQYSWLFEDIKNRSVEDIVILSGDHLYRMDYMRFVDHHRATNADVTIGCLPMDDSRASDFGLMKIDGNGRIVEFAEKPKGDALKAMAVDTTVLGLDEKAAAMNPYIASMGIYVFKKSAMIELLGQHPEMNDFGGEIIPMAAADYNVQAYLFNDYWEDIGTIKSFFHANLALTSNPPKFEFHNPEGPIYTSPRFLPPAKIIESQLSDAIVSHGAMVKKSNIKHSIIGLRARVGVDTVIEDTMIMGADYYESDEQRQLLESQGKVPIGIGEGTVLKNVIVDKNGRIGKNCTIVNKDNIQEASKEDEGYYIRDGIVVVLRNGTIPDNTVVNTVNVCIPTPASASDLTLCNNALALANTDQVSFACVSGGSEDGCMVKIRDGSADLTTLGASGMLPAYQEYDLFPLLAEVYGESKSSTEYYSVAVVNREFCDTNNPTLESLKGVNMCSTGYRKTAGWVAPIGLMTQSGVMEIVSNDPSVKSDAQSVSDFFGNVCAPLSTADGPRTDGTLYSPLCSGCQEDCSIDDKYYSYDGSFRCLMEGNGDVAFTKDDIVSTLALDGSAPAQWATKNKDDFRLLCPNSGCQSVENYTSCNFGRVPSHAIVGKRVLGQGDALGEAIKTALLNAARSPEFLSSATDINGIDGFFLSDGTTGLVKVDSNNFDEFFDPSLQKSFAGIKALQASDATPTNTPGTTVICFPVSSTTYGNFAEECNRIFSSVKSDAVAFSCSTAPTAEDCMQQVKSGKATLTKLGPSDIFLANRDYGLEPVVSEFYGGDVGNSYYSVAVVRKEFCDSNPSVFDLQGKRSCHTGYRRTAGWTAPVGYLVDSGVIPVQTSDKKANTDAESVASFFSATCAVGSNADGPSTGGGPWAGLCTACGSDCSDSSPYAGYEGTIRGLMEDACDVAFTKQETAPKVASDGSSPESWSTLSKDDLRLLCPLGGCKPIDEWQACNMAAIPAQAFVGKVDIQRTDSGTAVKAALVKAGENVDFVNAAKEVDGTADYILTSNTKSLKEVPIDQSSYDYLGRGATSSYLGIQTLDEAEDSGDSSGSLSGGAIAGIVIGCIVAGILIGGVVFMWYRKSRGKQSSYQAYQGNSAISNPII